MLKGCNRSHVAGSAEAQPANAHKILAGQWCHLDPVSRTRVEHANDLVAICIRAPISELTRGYETCVGAKIHTNGSPIDGDLPNDRVRVRRHDLEESCCGAAASRDLGGIGLCVGVGWVKMSEH